mmetsp:Transcript_5406/g.13589  ORF Transcript_5406/g.13589 Transcript_5406/m.13589 type:complete len:1066 (-) Transcript_5406:75-3272(-)|eukprot:CAMPEP_0174229630 /NCGR_PEP_ID=MMETSP0417-20130205/532_1 /TAXON_ID=242541 /ORGANISM="Mayorella sp, Strain BSH-02190019" /LENGTH=1065 /DNA_ID=CAMNT_0015307191 /DNA_START=46 /DNA_END=3243 /DNA_ORIENTATION=-
MASSASASAARSATSSTRDLTVLLLGSGGREHAIAWKLTQSSRLSRLICVPGNAGTRLLARSLSQTSLKIDHVTLEQRKDNNGALCDLAKAQSVDLVVVGPEDPLVQGVADALREAGIACFGPSALAARIEGSKVFAKALMQECGIPTARYASFRDYATAEAYLHGSGSGGVGQDKGKDEEGKANNVDYPVVIKADGLAAGKGVILPNSTEEARMALRSMLQDGAFGSAGNEVVIEERVNGVEISLLCFSDGKTISVMPAAQDHKRALDCDHGLNTGGMGSISPVPFVGPDEQEQLASLILHNAVEGMARRGCPFVGVLFAGVILTSNGPIVLEYNCRFGDPETQVLLPQLESDLLEVFLACTSGTLDQMELQWKKDTAFACVIAASKGYPESYPKGLLIDGLAEAEASGALLFHAGTRLVTEEAEGSVSSGGQRRFALRPSVLTNGGRVLAVVASGRCHDEAVRNSYFGLQHIRFDGMQYRRDIGRRFLSKYRLRVAILGSTRGTSSLPVLEACASGALAAEVCVVLSNRSAAPILEKARTHSIPAVFVSSKDRTREQYDAELMSVLDEFSVDVVLLVGYMRILSNGFVDRYEGRLLNVHPSLLPAFAGGMDLNVHQAVLDSKVAETGCTVHLVTREVDSGPIVVQKRCSVLPTDDANSLKTRVQALEGVALIEAIRLFRACRGSLFPPPTLEGSEAEALTYAQSGVSIDAGNQLVQMIKPFAKSTARVGTAASIGGFGSLFDMGAAGYSGEDTLLVGSTDGVGTKLLIAQQTNQHKTIGQDLVGMVVNDVVVTGAEPLFFLDYLATGHLDVSQASDVIEGVALACKQCNCALVGGETAEMPQMYSDNKYDVAGFAVGAVRRQNLLPRLESLCAGDLVIGLSSSGVHSNGFSLVRRVIAHSGLDWDSKCPFPSDHQFIKDELLRPTVLYVKEALTAMNTGKVKAAAHITGGGLLENIPRVLPDHLGVSLDMSKWILPPVFAWLRKAGSIKSPEMLRTFNCGIGFVLVVASEDAPNLLELIRSTNSSMHCEVIGTIEQVDALSGSGADPESTVKADQVLVHSIKW